jgi:hypothetical protein
MNIITRAFAYIKSLRTRPTATTSKKAGVLTISIQVDAAEAIKTLELLSSHVASLRSEIETSSILAEIRARFDKLDEGTDMILAAVANMQDHITGQPSMADTLDEATARMQDPAIGGTF